MARKYIDWKTYESRTRKHIHVRLCESKFDRLMKIHTGRQYRKDHTLSETVRLLMHLGMDMYESDPRFKEIEARLDNAKGPKQKESYATNLMQRLNEKDK